MRQALKKLNKNWWIIPVLCFFLTLALLVAVSELGGPRPLASAKLDARKDIYSSLTGSSSGLLGFALAAVAILAAFAPKSGLQGSSRVREQAMADARSDVAKCLLVTSLFLMVILVASTIGIGMDGQKKGNFPIAVTVLSAALASLTGLLISGLGVTLSILERNSAPSGD